MCGIAGIIAFSDKGLDKLGKINNAVSALSKRGPDGNGIYSHHRVSLGHARLSIIDTSTAGSQPMTDASGRYTIIFNGEFVNFQEHKNFVIEKGYHLKSESDTEILLYLYIIEGEECLQRINGFFAFAIYDKEEETVCIARDRFGEKPLLYYQDENNFLFASEMKALAAMDIPHIMDEVSLFIYLQQNYISAPHSIYKDVKKLMPGCFLKIGSSQSAVGSRQSAIAKYSYYEIEKTLTPLSYPDQQKKLVELLDAAVQKRLISDVPIGAFLSGGIDSSVIVALAAQHTKQLNTFSIGFRDEPLFDETHYANLVAKKCNTTHTVFSLTNNDLFENLFEMLDYLDEPFADSSALNVYILSKQTRKYATVALSGDGADELFGGYNKHAAELKARQGGTMASVVKLMNPLFDFLPQSRNSKTGNKIRQLKKFGEGMKLSAKQRYWSWAGYATPLEAEHLLKHKTLTSFERITTYTNRKDAVLQYLRDEGGDMNTKILDMGLDLMEEERSGRERAELCMGGAAIG